MSSFSYSFSMAMLHSLWQSALLWLLYMAVNRFFLQRNSPLEKRNFLFVLLSTQLALFILSFFIYLSIPGAAAAENSFADITDSFLSQQDIYIITPWLFRVYLTIISYKLIKAIYTWYRFKQQYNRGLHKPHIDLKLFTELKAHHYGIKRKVKLWLSSTINTPVTFGFFKPVILLPLALTNNISLQQAETLILHELTHIRTNDYLLNWFLLVAENIFFFNPFIRSLCKNIRLEREKYCDLSVIAFNYPPVIYAETLLKAERIKQMIPAYQLAAVQQKKQLLQRINFFTSGNQVYRQNRRRLFVPVIALLMLMLFFSAALFRTNTVFNTASVNSIPLIGIPALSAGEDEAFADNIELPVIKSNDLDKLEAAIKKQKPAIEKQLKKMKPLLLTLRQKVEAIAEKAAKDMFIPVALKEPNTDEIKEVMIKEEVSGSKATAVKVYKLKFQNGQWVLVPEWMATAKEVLTETLPSSKKKDSSVKRVLPPQ